MLMQRIKICKDVQGCVKFTYPNYKAFLTQGSGVVLRICIFTNYPHDIVGGCLHK